MVLLPQVGTLCLTTFDDATLGAQMESSVSADMPLLTLVLLFCFNELTKQLTNSVEQSLS
jgi:hypothetical protein